MNFQFTGELIEWRGPAPFYFVRIPAEISDLIKADSSLLSYGWGVIPVSGKIGATSFTTSLIPREGIFLLPVKSAVRVPEKISLGDEVEVELGLVLAGGF